LGPPHIFSLPGTFPKEIRSRLGIQFFHIFPVQVRQRFALVTDNQRIGDPLQMVDLRLVKCKFECKDEFNQFDAWVYNGLEHRSSEVVFVVITKSYQDSDAHFLLFWRNYSFLEAVARIFKGRVLSRDGKHLEAITSIQKGLEMFYMTGMVTTQTLYLQALAEAYCAANQVDNGLEVILKTEQIEQETGEARHKSALQRIKGDLYLLAACRRESFFHKNAPL
jgi:hypothetical protein